jgi:hypothetical protein
VTAIPQRQAGLAQVGDDTAMISGGYPLSSCVNGAAASKRPSSMGVAIGAKPPCRTETGRWSGCDLQVAGRHADGESVELRGPRGE